MYGRGIIIITIIIILIILIIIIIIIIIMGMLLAKSRAQCAVQKDTEKYINTYNGQN